MKIKLLAALAALGMSGNALAYGDCTPELPPNYIPGTLRAVPTDGIIKLRADAPAEPGTVIGTAKTPMTTSVDYVCQGDIVRTRRPLIGTHDTYTNLSGMYRTNIEGIGVRYMVTLGSASAPLPTSEKIQKNTPGAVSITMTAPQEFMTAYFYKVNNNVSLKTRHSDPNLLVSSKDIADYYIENTLITKYAMDNVYIIGIPVCKVSNPIPVDFNTVDAKKIANGEVRPLEFNINCLSDYGNYTAIATIHSIERTSDNKYIKVTDSNGDTDSLIIEITDDKNNNVMVDDSTKVRINDVKSGEAATFKWKAKLKKQDGKPYPKQGPFNAIATITLNIE